MSQKSQDRQKLANQCRNPVQPVYADEQGVHRFKHNAIVEYILDNGGINLNHIANLGNLFTQDDKTQFAQLIGYSVSGAGDLSYFSDEAWAVGNAASRRLEHGRYHPLTELEQKEVIIMELQEKVSELEHKLQTIADIVEN